MKIQQRRWTETSGWVSLSGSSDNSAGPAQLVFAFGATAALYRRDIIKTLCTDYPGAHIFGCSTAGEICNTQVTDGSLTVTAVHLEHTPFRSAEVNLANVKDSFHAGQRIAQKLPDAVADSATGQKRHLSHVLVLTDGLKVNGTEFVSGMIKHLPREVAVTGGMAGDGERFLETLVFCDNVPQKDSVAAVGLYGNRLKVGFGSLGGWDPFGPERLITKSRANVLYEVDGRSALALYKKYLGAHAWGLPATGLLFPLSIRTSPQDRPVVRTILSMDEKEQSLTFAGDIPEGGLAQLMKANFDRLIDGAAGAARTTARALGAFPPELVLLISCVGRKLVLKQRVEEEVDAVREVLPGNGAFAGFYSYGEISPFAPGARCELHNQTMTITAFSEQ